MNVIVGTETLIEPVQGRRKKAMLGLFRRTDGAILLAVPNQNADDEATGLTPVAIFFFGNVPGAVDARVGALVRLAKHVGQDGFVAGVSVGQVIAAVKSEADALGIEERHVRAVVDPAGPDNDPPPEPSRAPDAACEPRAPWGIDLTMAFIVGTILLALWFRH